MCASCDSWALPSASCMWYWKLGLVDMACKTRPWRPCLMQEGSVDYHTTCVMQEGSVDYHTTCLMQEGSVDYHTTCLMQEGPVCSVKPHLLGHKGLGLSHWLIFGTRLATNRGLGLSHRHILCCAGQVRLELSSISWSKSCQILQGGWRSALWLSTN